MNTFKFPGILPVSFAAALCCAVAIHAADQPAPGQQNKSKPPTGYEANQPGQAHPAGQTQPTTPEAFIKQAAQSGLLKIKLGQMASEKAQNPAIKQFGQILVTDHSRANQRLLQLATQKNIQLPAALRQQLAQLQTGREQPADQAGLTPQERQQRAPAQPAVQDRQPVRERTPQPDTEGNTDTERKQGAFQQRDQPRAAQDADEHAKSEQMIQKLNGLSGEEFDRQFLDQTVQMHQKDISLFEGAAKSINDAEVKAFASSSLPTLRQHLQRAQALSASQPATDQQP